MSVKHNVVNFPKPYRAQPDDTRELVDYCEPPIRQSPLRNAARGTVRGLAYLLFLILLWIRGPIHFVLTMLAGLFMISSVVLLIGGGYPKLLYISGGVSFGSFVLAWAYDRLLYALSPVPIFLN